MTDTLTALLPLIEPLSRSIARSYPGVESDDIHQELCLFVLQHGQDLDPCNESGCRYILGRAGHIYAMGERAAMLNHTCQYNYRPQDVRRILETGALSEDREAWTLVHVPEDAKSLKGSAAIEVTLDIRSAMLELSYADYRAIHGRYHDGEVPAAGTAERKRLDRAVDRLTEQLNGYSVERLRRMGMRGYPGARRVISNAQAQAEIGELYG